MEGFDRTRSWRLASRSMSRSFSRSMSRGGWGVEGAFSGRQTTRYNEDEEALKWAAIEKLPTYDRLRTSILQSFVLDERHNKEVDVRKLDLSERQEFIDRIFKVAEEDNERFLRKFRNRIDKVGIELPTVEVRFEHLTIEADCFIGSRALPTLTDGP